MLLHDCSLLADENIPAEVIQRLNELINIKSVESLGLKSATDTDILRHANSAGLVVLTQDSDFGKLAFMHKQHHAGIINLRPERFLPAVPVLLMRQLLLLDTELVASFIIVATYTDKAIHIRIRNAIQSA